MEHAQQRTVGDYLATLRRRKWVVLAAVVIATAVAYVLAESEQKLYSASADVLLTNTATGIQSVLVQNPTSVMQTEEEIAGSPSVANRVLRATHITDRSVGQLLSEASFSSPDSQSILRISITDRDPQVALRLADSYASQYAQYRRQLDVSFVTSARDQLEARMKALADAGGRHSALYGTLVQKDEDLLQLEALQTANALVLRKAGDATQVQPRPKRDAALGFGVGLVLGIALALIWDALDTRVRTAHDIAALVDLPLLGRLPAPSRRFRSERRLVTVEEPTGTDAESFRMLRTNLDFVNLDGQAKLIMVTSSTASEGKSTTVANLAVALARAGRRVAVVDLDLRRPIIHELFDLPPNQGGLTSVALGRAELAQAIANIAIPTSSWRAASAGDGANGKHAEFRTLKVLTAGVLPPDPGEFVGTAAVNAILQELKRRADVVLVDAPPLVGVGDAVSLSGVVDGVILVVRLGTANRPLLREAHRLLESAPVTKLGFVITDAAREEGYAYDSYGYYGASDRDSSAARPVRLERGAAERA